MGFWRSVYYVIGWEYYGSKERWEDHQKRQKYLLCEQLKNTDKIKNITIREIEIKDDKKINKINNEEILINKKFKVRPDTPIPQIESTTANPPDFDNVFMSKTDEIGELIKNLQKCKNKKCNNKNCCKKKK